jgi:hypothetical protein
LLHATADESYSHALDGRHRLDDRHVKLTLATIANYDLVMARTTPRLLAFIAAFSTTLLGASLPKAASFHERWDGCSVAQSDGGFDAGGESRGYAVESEGQEEVESEGHLVASAAGTVCLAVRSCGGMRPADGRRVARVCLPILSIRGPPVA